MFAPVFRGLGKPVYGIHDQPDKPLDVKAAAKTADFTHYTVLNYKSVEKLLIAEVPVDAQRRFSPPWLSARTTPPDAPAPPPPPRTRK
ncbi:hypothetical protein ACRAWF_09590 [Streptomyces sp. L7]